MGGEVLEKLRDYYGVHWVGVKFYSFSKREAILKESNNDYSQKENYFDSQKIFSSDKKDYKFCEALDEAISHPIYLGSDNLSCERAKFVFGWSLKSKNDVMKSCQEKFNLSNEEVKNLFYDFPEVEKDILCIGLNTSEVPDLAIAYLNPRVAMKIIRRYNKRNRENLNVTVSSVMSICGSLTVRSYLEEDVMLSFGCQDSRRYSNIDRDRLGLCVPKKLFNAFLPSNYKSAEIEVG